MHWKFLAACLATWLIACPTYGQTVVGGGPTGQGIIIPQYPPGPSNNIIPMKFQIEDEAYDSTNAPWTHVVYDTFREVGTSALYIGDLNGLVAFSSMVFHMFYQDSATDPSIAGIWNSIIYHPNDRIPHNDDGFSTDVTATWIMPTAQTMNKVDKTFIPGLFTSVGVPTNEFTPGFATNKMITNFFVISNETYSTYTVTNLAAETKTQVSQNVARPSMLPLEHVQFCVPDNSFIEPTGGGETWHARVGAFARFLDSNTIKPTNIYFSVFNFSSNSWEPMLTMPIGGSRPYFHELTMLKKQESFENMRQMGWLNLVTIGNKKYYRIKLSVRFDDTALHTSTYETSIWEFVSTIPGGPGGLGGTSP